MTADPRGLQALLLELGVALTMTGDAVSEVQTQLRAIATAHGFGHARVSVFPTLLIVLLVEDQPAGVRMIDSIRQLPLDQASEVIGIARRAEAATIEPAEAIAELERALAAPPRFGIAVMIVAHGVLTVGLGLVIRPAPADLWIYAALGLLVGGLSVAAARSSLAGGYLLPVFAAALVSAIAFLAHGGNDAASLRLTIPPLVTFLPGALLTMATVDLAMGETVTARAGSWRGCCSSASSRSASSSAPS